MSYLDQITVGSTTYDLQDSGAQRVTLTGTSAPTTSTVGVVGQHYINTTATGHPYEYVCTAVSSGTYTWIPVDASEAPVTSVNSKTGAVVLDKTDIGLGNVDNVKQYSASNPPPYPVTSVNGSTGAVTISVPSAATATPSDLGTSAVGTSTKWAKEDHVHKMPSASDVGALPDTTSIPSKTSDLTNDSGYITGMVELSYGSSTWNDFITAYNAKKVVYCRASSNSNPASGSQTRKAFMAYVDNAENPTNVEFQYYRSVSTHSDSQQGDQVYVYKLVKSSGWSVTVREAYSKIATGTGISKSYSNGTITLSSTVSVPTASDATPENLGTAAAGSSANYSRADHVHAMPTASDVGALPSSTVIPSKVSDLTNDSGFVNASGAAAAAPVQSVNGKTGAVTVVEDDQTWNGVSLVKQSVTNTGDSTYVPLATSLTPVNMSFTPVKKTPTANAIAKYDNSSYLYSTTPSDNDNSTKVATTAYVDSAIDDLPEPMVFKGSLGTGGTITTLPAASSSNIGFTYKVITAGTYASQAAKVGDTFISDGTSWVLIPSGDEPSGTVTSVGVSNATNGGLSVSGSPITSSGTISIGHSNVLTNAQTTQAVYPIKIDKNGHISAYGSAVSIPSKTSDLTNDSGFITSSSVPVAATATPANLGTAAVGTSSKYAKEDHVHNYPDVVHVGSSAPTNTNIELWLDSSSGGNSVVSSVDGKTGTVTVLPSGGTTGQVLKKVSSTNYDVTWANESGSVTSVNGQTGDVEISTIAVQDSTPTGGELVWIDTDESGESITIPQIDDNNVSSDDTWSSQKIRDFIYPVGSIYMSVNSTSPATIFGGTWEQIQDTFLLAAGNTYTAGDSGGSATHAHTTGNHTLTINEIPGHTHYIYGGNNSDPPDWFGGSGNPYGILQRAGTTYDYLSYTGGGQAHNHGNTGSSSNMPPYLAVYVWKRTA